MISHLVEWYIDIYMNTYGADTTYTDIMIQFNTYLKRMINSTTFSTFSNVILAVGLCMMVFYFFTDLSEKATMKQLSMMQMGKSFMLLLGTTFILYHTKELFIMMMDFVETLNEGLSVNNMGYSKVSKFLSDPAVQIMMSRCVTDHFGLMSIIGYSLTAFILTMVSLATRAYIIYYSATRIIELFVYYMFAPIGLADIFENGPGGVVNTRSSGFQYAKTILAIMMQIVVISVICQTYSLVTTAVNVSYYTENGKGMLSDSLRQQENSNSGLFGEILEGFNNALTNIKTQREALYPLMTLEYTDHKANILESAYTTLNNGWNHVTEFIDALSGEIDEDEERVPVENLKDSEVYSVMHDVVNLDGEIQDRELYNKILENNKYRTTLSSTTRFFDWCTGSDGKKMMLFIVLMVVKVLMIFSASKLCNYIMGTYI